MNHKNAKLFLIPAILFAALFVFGNEARADTYYATPADNLASKVSALQAGDTLILKDGTYYQSLNVTVSGTQTSPITIKAENDGKATIDGQETKIPCKINANYIYVEGIVCKNAMPYYEDNLTQIFYIPGGRHDINVRRVSALSTVSTTRGYGPNFEVDDGCYNILFEDTVAYGPARVLYNIRNSNNVRIRRAFGYFTAQQNSCPAPPCLGDFIQIYGARNGIVENSISFMKHSTVNYGIAVWGHSGEASSNKVYGNVVIDVGIYAYRVVAEYTNPIIHDNDFRHNVAINSTYGMAQSADTNFTARNNTLVNTGGAIPAFSVAAFGQTDPWPSDYRLNLLARNNSYYISPNKGFLAWGNWIGSMDYNYNNYWLTSDTSFGGSNKHIDPQYNTTTYGKGAYLMVPPALKGKGEGGADIGAEVLYRYQDGVLTSQPLWPWPMEDRIKTETGISVTYESGGGIWKTLDGVYSGGDTTPPSAPGGLTVQ